MSNKTQVRSYNTFQGQSIRHENSSTVPEETPSYKPLEIWNHPRSNVLKTLATFWSFLIMGASDAAYGVSSLLILRGLCIVYSQTHTATTSIRMMRRVLIHVYF